jgi:hypothetical protein
MTQFAYDSMPPSPTGEDFTLHYRGFLGLASHCRVRVYRPAGSVPVIVATQAYDVEDSGTSITNRAELVHRLAWSQAGEPWPALFVEHYAELQDPENPHPDDDIFLEHWAFVSFPQNANGTPVLHDSHGDGTMITIDPSSGQQTSRSEPLTLDMAFGKPEWEHTDRAEIESLIGIPLLADPIRTEVAPATLENSPGTRFIAEHFLDD